MDATERIAQLEARVAELEELVRKQAAKIERLEHRLRQNSSNSHRPPSTDAPGTPPRASPPPSGRKPGGQPGHPPSNRELFCKEEIDEKITVGPKRCRKCHRSFGPSGGKNRRAIDFHQVVEIPAVSARVIEVCVVQDECECCGEWTSGELPAEFAALVGPRLQAAASVLSGRFRLSRREVLELLIAVFGPKARVSLGTVKNLEDQTAEALTPVYAHAHQAAQQASVAYFDETGWRERHRLAWLWVMVTSTLCIFQVASRRNRRVFAALAGSFDGDLVTDRWKVYWIWPKRHHQFCWAHLQRDLEGWKERGGRAGRIGSECLTCASQMFDLWHRFKRGEIARSTLQAYLKPIQRTLRRQFRRAQRLKALRATATELLKCWPCLWVFSRRPGVEPTNNTSEQAIRPAVLWRKGCFGSRSSQGARFVERMLTVAQTLRRQGRALLDFVVAAIMAFRRGTSPPSLLPVG
jgi:transposase